MRTEKNKHGEFPENEIYQHITNCQTFLAYGVDETKMLSRRAAFKSSMQFLYDLAESGNIRAATRFSFSSFFSRNGVEESPETKMKDFGMKIAKSVLEKDEDAGKATATLLLIALDGAYNSVLAVRALTYPIPPPPKITSAGFDITSDTILVLVRLGLLHRWSWAIRGSKDGGRQDRPDHM